MPTQTNNLSSKELAILLKYAAQDGADNAIKKEKPISNKLAKATAYRLYGRSNVDRWLREGLISTHTDDSAQTFLDRSKLETVSVSSNRITYLSVTDR